MSTTQEPSQVSQFDLEATPGEGGIGEAARVYWDRIKGGDLGALPAVIGAVVLVIVFGSENQERLREPLVQCGEDERKRRLGHAGASRQGLDERGQSLAVGKLEGERVEDGTVHDD